MKKERACYIILIALFLLSVVFTLFTGCDNASKELNTNVTEATEALTEAENNLRIVFDSESEYSIMYTDNASSTEIEAVKNLRSAIEEKSSVLLNLTTDFEKIYPVSQYEIVIGHDTERNGSAFNVDTSEIAEYDCLIQVIDSRLVFIGGSDFGTYLGVDYFINNVLSADEDGNILVPKDYAYTYQRGEAKTNIKVMSQNLLATDTEYASIENADKYTIEARKSRILSIITDNAPDVIGLQECSAPWREYFNSIGQTTGYTRIGASKNEKIGILYNSEKLRVVSSYSFWLSSSPESQNHSNDWNNGNTTIERLGMYVIFEVRETKERFIHFNTHIGFENSTLASNQTNVIIKYINRVRDSYDYPIVITGDFNYNAESSQYKLFMSADMADSKYTAANSIGGGSFNKFISREYASIPIDQVLFSHCDWIAHTYKVDYTTFDGYFYSDHYAVVAELEFLK